MPAKKSAAHVLQSEIVLLEPRIEAPLQTDGDLDQNASDNTISYHIPYTTNPNFTKAFAGAATNTGHSARGSMGGFEGSPKWDIG
jgi:hypothetical protein